MYLEMPRLIVCRLQTRGDGLVRSPPRRVYSVEAEQGSKVPRLGFKKLQQALLVGK